jgi:PhzF family phenazine biosynthesis protein
MKCRQWVVNSFADSSLGGNPAAVVLLEEWIEDAWLLGIATQNRYSETAYLVRTESSWELRWFAPSGEVDLCGHATLASAWVLLHEVAPGKRVEFVTREAGRLAVERKGDVLWMDFPTRMPVQVEVTDRIREATGLAPREAWLSRDLLLVLDDEESVRDCRPDMAGIASLSEHFAVVPTAPGKRGGFVSRYFAPGAGIPEDPVTGSSHSSLIPFWSNRLGTKEMTARQLSPEGGTVLCQDRGERVGIGGRAIPFLRGTIEF